MCQENYSGISVKNENSGLIFLAKPLTGDRTLLLIIVFFLHKEVAMSETACGIQINQKVPDFKLETYEPTKGDFGEFSLETQKAAKKWTVLFFYPADFTFV